MHLNIICETIDCDIKNQCSVARTDDISRIKEMAGFANTYFSAVTPGLEDIYTNTGVLGWFLSFQVSRGVRGTTINAHVTTCRKVLEWLESKVCL